MPIRARLHQKRKVLAYHREYGSLQNPPLRYGMWPNGAFVATQNHPRNKKRSVILGWTDRRRSGHYGVWIATKLSWVTRQTPVAYHGDFDPAKDYKYVGEADSHEDALDMLKEAYGDHFNMSLV